MTEGNTSEFPYRPRDARLELLHDVKKMQVLMKTMDTKTQDVLEWMHDASSLATYQEIVMKKKEFDESILNLFEAHKEMLNNEEKEQAVEDARVAG